MRGILRGIRHATIVGVHPDAAAGRGPRFTITRIPRHRTPHDLAGLTAPHRKYTARHARKIFDDARHSRRRREHFHISRHGWSMPAVARGGELFELSAPQEVKPCTIRIGYWPQGAKFVVSLVSRPAAPRCMGVAFFFTVKKTPERH